MQKPANQEVVGQQLGVLAASPYGRRFVPVDDALLFTLFPDVVRQRGTTVVLRMGVVRLLRTDDGKISGRCTRWWDLDKLQEEWDADPRSVPAGILAAKDALLAAMEAHSVAPFDYDLPLFMDAASTRNRAYDWDTLEWDVFRGLNSKIPFPFTLPDDVGAAITRELPFLDVEEHFRTHVSGDLCLSLIRQLLSQYTVCVGSMDLVPLRWVAKVAPGDHVVVETGVPFVINLPNIHKTVVDVGAISVNLSREPRRRSRQRKPRKRS